MSGEWDGLRAAAEAATAGPRWTHETPPPEMRRPGSEVCWTIHSNPQLVVSEVGLNNAEANADFIAAVSPDVVLGLLDRLQAAEQTIGLMRRPACWGPNDHGDLMVDMEVDAYEEILDHVLAALQGTETDHARRTRESSVARGLHLSPSERAAQVRDALPADAPQPHVTAPLSASGAEGDHGGRRDGEGLA